MKKKGLVLSEIEGFTIIEILIVATIILFISSFGLATYNEISRNSRDAKRQSDLDSLRNAVELYKSSDTTSTYPVQINDIPANILRTIPVDPKNHPYTYTALPTNCNNTTIPCTSYTITAESETVNNGVYQANSDSIILTTTTPTPNPLTPTIIQSTVTPTPIPPTSTPIHSTNTPMPPTSTPTPIVNLGCNLTCSLNSQCSTGFCYSTTNTCRYNYYLCYDYSDCSCPELTPTATPIPPTSTPIPPTSTPTPVPPTSTPAPTTTPIPPTNTPTPSQHTIVVPIASGSDDAWQDADPNNRTVDVSSDYLKLGWYMSRAGFRFTNAQFTNISQRTIVNAYLTLTSNQQWLSSEIISMRVYGEKTINCNTYQAVYDNLGQRTLTTNYQPWLINTLWNTNMSYSTPSLTSIIQEIVDQPSYNGGAMCIFINNYGSANWIERKIASFEHTYQEPYLTITYLQ